MRCGDAQELFPEFLRRTLDHGEERGLRDHLDVCRECRQELEAERQLRSALAGGLTVRTLEADLGAVQADVRERNAVPMSRFAAFAFLAVLMTFGFSRSYEERTAPAASSSSPVVDPFGAALTRHRSVTVDPVSGAPVVSLVARDR